MTTPASARRAFLIATWAVAALAVTFVEAVVRLGARALTTIAGGLTLGQWLVLLLVVGTLAYFEGYRALQRKFAPRVVARALAAGQRLTGCLPVVAAPLYALGLFGAPRGTMLRSWLGVAAIVAAVLVVRAMPEPWRGIVDAGVAAALLWGLTALLVQAQRSLRRVAIEQPSAPGHALSRPTSRE